jgi:hypothetical protein
MIPNGIRMAGTIPYRNRVKISWNPKPVTNWWDTVGDTLNINSPADDYGFTPNAMGSVSGSSGNVTYRLMTAANAFFRGTTLCGAVGQPMEFTSDFSIVWENGNQGPFSAQDAIRIGLSTDGGFGGTSSYFAFIHDKAGVNPPGENWQCVANYNNLQPNAAFFQADSGVAPGPLQELKLTLSADGKTFTWFIDGAQVAQVVGDSSHIYFDPTGGPIVAFVSNSSIFNSAQFTFASKIIIK